MMNDENEHFAKQLNDYKEMVILRQKECVEIAKLLENMASTMSRKAKYLKLALIILGVIVATKGGIDAFMSTFGEQKMANAVLGLVFLLFGAAISVIAGIEAGFRFDSRAGELRSLSSLCKTYDSQFMSDYKKFISPAKPDVTLAKLESLIDLQNESLAHIRYRSDSLGVDLSTINISYQIDG